jgi:hypothetical protein
VADCAFAILPLFIVWDLRVKKKTKILTAAILAFAAMYVKKLMNSPTENNWHTEGLSAQRFVSGTSMGLWMVPTFFVLCAPW